MKKTRWLALFVVLLLVVAACGGDGDSGDEDKPVVNVFGAFSGY